MKSKAKMERLIQARFGVQPVHIAEIGVTSPKRTDLRDISISIAAKPRSTLSHAGEK